MKSPALNEAKSFRGKILASFKAGDFMNAIMQD